MNCPLTSIHNDDGVFINTGEFSNDSTFTNLGEFDNIGSLYQDGVFTNDGFSLINEGEIRWNSAGSLGGMVNNYDPDGIALNSNGGEFKVYDDLTKITDAVDPDPYVWEDEDDDNDN